MQIDGEVIAPSSIPNARNYAAGALNLKSEEEFKQRVPNLSFVAHDMRPSTGFRYWSEVMQHCSEVLGFHTDLYFDCTDYPTDGVVFRIDSLKVWNECGFTAHHPRGSIAFKEQKAGVATTLLDVVWQTGKSGVVTPVALLEPVMIGEAKVSRATLHNMEYINELGLELGCQVEVIRSGEIIPRIVRRLN
jgi:DNA ligase (NAD+)